MIWLWNEVPHERIHFEVVLYSLGVVKDSPCWFLVSIMWRVKCCEWYAVRMCKLFKFNEFGSFNMLICLISSTMNGCFVLHFFFFSFSKYHFNTPFHIKVCCRRSFYPTILILMSEIYLLHAMYSLNFIPHTRSSNQNSNFKSYPSKNKNCFWFICISFLTINEENPLVSMRNT